MYSAVELLVRLIFVVLGLLTGPVYMLLEGWFILMPAAATLTYDWLAKLFDDYFSGY